MKLTESLKNRDVWEKKGYEMPQFDREQVIKATLEHPQWLHFGAGNIFRAFPAVLLQELLDRGEAQTGLVVCEGFDREIVEKAYRPL